MTNLPSSVSRATNVAWSGATVPALVTAAKAWPKYRNFSITEMMESVTKEPMTALARAIKTNDATRFASTYEQLTAACNTCHQSAERGVIVIQVPSWSPFADQDLRPPKK